jgi:chromosome segregation ATPase
VSDDLLDLPFDQFQRYRLVADMLNDVRVGRGRFTILDVGGRTALLRRFLPRDHVRIVDLEVSDEKGLVLGDGAALPFASEAVDAVVAFDTLEHVPKRRRRRFLTECHRVARQWVIIAGPYRTGPVQRAERLLREFLKEKLGIEHRYLEEHHTHGLPVRGEVERHLASLGGDLVSIGHASLTRWLPLMMLSMYMDRDAPLRGIARHLHRFYNELLHPHDHEAPVYRHAVVAALGGAALPDPDAILARGALERKATEAPTHLLRELLRFDVQRDVVETEWQRLKEVIDGLEADLGGHRASLAEIVDLRSEQDVVIEDLQVEFGAMQGELAVLGKEAARQSKEQGKVIATLEEDLTGHRELVTDAAAELGREREETQQERLVFEEDLTAHAETIEELRGLHAAEVEGKEGLEALLAEGAEEQARERETLEVDLAGHGETIEELRGLHASEVEGKEALEALLAENAEEHARERETLEVDLAEHGSVIGELRSDVQVGEQERETLHGELEERSAEQAEVVGALEADLEGHRDLARDARAEVDVREAELEVVRVELERVVEDFERQRGEQQQVIEESTADLEGHRSLAEELRSEIAESVEALERAHEMALRERAEQADVAATLEADLAGHRASLADLRAELEKSVAAVRAVESACAERDRALAAMSERLAVAEELGERLRETLNRRFENLSRALVLRKRRY